MKKRKLAGSGHKQMKLEFYEDGRLKSEERYWNDQIEFGVYYLPDGRVDKTVGKRLAWKNITPAQ